MKIIVGLGNPEGKYQLNRHNVGFMLVDKIKEALDFPDFEFNKKFNAEISERTIGNEKIILAKPQTFMNKSGEAVQAILSFYKLDPEDLIVIHDDLDILIGNHKIQRDVHSVGHNGIESIIERIGTQDFTRVRVGVEMEAGRESRKIPGQDFVLQDFSEEELVKISNLSQNIKADLFPAITLPTGRQAA